MNNINDLVEIAKSQIGVEEDPQHQNKGSAILKYQQSTNVAGQGWPWCAAFVDWCVQQWVIKDNIKIAHIPRTASAFGLIDWANDNHLQVFNSPISKDSIQPISGDIVVYEFSHTGIVSKLNDDKYDFFAIEGNTNSGGGRDGYEVCERGRHYSLVKKFIRLPI